MNTLNVKAVCFDLDGTLANSLNFMKNSLYNFLKLYTKNKIIIDFDELNGPSLECIVKYLILKHRLKVSLKEGISEYLKIIQNGYNNVSIMPGAFRLIRTIHNKKVPLAIVTSNNRELTLMWLKKRGILSYFDVIVSGDDVEHSKPHPEPYLKAIQCLDIHASEVIAVEDTITGFKSAEAAFLIPFLVTPRYENVPCYTKNHFSSLSDLHNFLEVECSFR